jgi:3-oxoadipate enol-lactonase
MKVKANGITFNYDIGGPESAPWLIFSNSLATNLHMWDPQADALKSEFRMLRYDQRGHGQTEATCAQHQEGALVRRVDGLRHRDGSRAEASRPVRPDGAVRQSRAFVA